MSCCKVKVDLKKENETPVLTKFFKNFWSLIGSVILLTIFFPFLYLFCLFFIFSAFVFNKNNKVSDFIKLLKQGLKKIRKSEDMELDDENETLSNFIKNPEKFNIIGLDEEHSNKD